MQVAVLGLGKMGAPIAERLLNAGHELTVWNRTPGRAEPLAKRGARVAASAADAVGGAEVIFSIVFDDEALEEILYAGGALKAMTPGAIHVNLSTLGVACSERMTIAHRTERLTFVAAPVFGRPIVAAEGRLAIAVGGAPEAIAKVRPLLETFSRKVMVVSENPAAAHGLKLSGNFLMMAMIASLSEGVILGEALGIKPNVFLETVNEAAFQSPFYAAYSKIILNPPQPPGGTVALGEKDTRLFQEAAKEVKVKTPLADIFKATLDRAIVEGKKEEDWPGAYYQLTRDSTWRSE
jgi:3-hydroxyisobutyrate dehydrogenase-like beta-hydroxyacid dehydrogenase